MGKIEEKQMKKFLYILSIFFILMSLSSVFASNINIVISPQSVFVNGASKDFEVYNIDGSNFFKLRDIAYALNNTSSNFEVSYNSEKSLIEVKKGASYTSVGGEMTKGEDKSRTAILSNQKLIIDDVETNITAYNIGGNNFFKLRDMGTALGFGVDFDSAQNRVVIESAKSQIANIIDVSAKKYEGVNYIEVKLDAPALEYTAFPLSEPDRIILDIKNSNIKIEERNIDINKAGITSVRLGDQGENKSRVVLDLDATKKYVAVQSKDKTAICIALAESFEYPDDKIIEQPIIVDPPTVDVPNSGDTQNDDEMPDWLKPTTSGEQVYTPEITSGDELNDEPINVEDLITISSIKYSSTTDSIKITNVGKLDYEVSTLNEPYRIVVDFKYALLDVDGPTSIKPKNSNISEIRFSQKDESTVRVVLELALEAPFDIEGTSKSTKITIGEPIPMAPSYEVFEDGAKLTLYGIKKTAISATESTRYNRYTLKYTASKYKLDSDTLDIDDDFVQDITITSGKIVINGQKKVKYKMKQVGSDVVITISKASSNFVVLLDAGHGGKDPGACNGNDYEKIYNLEIMLKVKELLEDEAGIEVRASRTRDEYIDREGRINFILDNDDANLLVSVHNNSLGNKNYQGTMVLYYNKPNEKSDYGITSKELATIVKDNIVDATDMVDRGVVSRDDLWILEQNASNKISESSGEIRTVTNLPAILCEVCFMSNDEELARLKTDRFQNAVAEAIYEGILEARDIMQ